MVPQGCPRFVQVVDCGGRVKTICDAVAVQFSSRDVVAEAANMEKGQLPAGERGRAGTSAE